MVTQQSVQDRMHPGVWVRGWHPRFGECVLTAVSRKDPQHAQGELISEALELLRHGVKDAVYEHITGKECT